MLSVFKPAVLEVLVSHACGVRAISMPIPNDAREWWYVQLPVP
jgi:hypothetical protein